MVTARLLETLFIGPLNIFALSVRIRTYVGWGLPLFAAHRDPTTWLSEPGIAADHDPEAVYQIIATLNSDLH